MGQYHAFSVYIWLGIIDNALVAGSLCLRLGYLTTAEDYCWDSACALISFISVDHVLCIVRVAE